MGDLVSREDFFEYKVSQYVAYWKYGRDTTEQFKINMIRMGYDKDDVEETLNEYFET